MLGLKVFFLLVFTMANFKKFEAQVENDQNVEACEPITGECTDQGYSHTSLLESSRNSFATQLAADAKIKSFDILTPCSQYLKIFLCATYKPSCYTEASALLIRPCRSMCIHVHSRCYPLMHKFKRKWSSELNCSRYLEDSSQRCMNDPGYPKDPPASNLIQQQIDLLFDKVVVVAPQQPLQVVTPQHVVSLTTRKLTSTTNDRNHRNGQQLDEKYICLNDFVDDRRNVSKCYLKCDSNVEFSVAQKQVARLLALVLSILSLLSGSITCLIHLVRPKPVALFPVKIYLFISITTLGYSLTQAIGLAIGINTLACERLEIGGHYYGQIISPQPFENSYCSLTLLASNLFSSSLTIWWLVMTISWYIMVRCQLDSSEIDRKFKHYLYSLALALPAIHTIVLLITRYAEISELSGLCTLGVGDSEMALKFHILPSTVYLILGLLFILLGFKKILLTKTPTTISRFHEFLNAHNVSRLGFCAFLGSLPLLLIFSCQLCEYLRLYERKKAAYIEFGLFIAKSVGFFSNSMLILALNCCSNSKNFNDKPTGSTTTKPTNIILYNENNNTCDTMNSSSSSTFEKKLNNESLVEESFQTMSGGVMEGRRSIRVKCGCRDMGVKGLSLELSREFWGRGGGCDNVETPINEHHYCTPNVLAAYQNVKQPVVANKLIHQQNWKNMEDTLRLKQNNNKFQNSKYV